MATWSAFFFGGCLLKCFRRAFLFLAFGRNCFFRFLLRFVLFSFGRSEIFKSHSQNMAFFCADSSGHANDHRFAYCFAENWNDQRHSFFFDCTQLNANTFTLLFRMGPFYEWSTWFFLQLNGCCVSCYLTLEISFAVFCWKEAHIMMASCPFYFTTDCTQQPKYNLYYPFLVIWLCVVCGFFLRLRAFRFIFISSILIHSIVYYSNGHFIHLEFSLHILIEVQSNISHLWLGS